MKPKIEAKEVVRALLALSGNTMTREEMDLLLYGTSYLRLEPDGTWVRVDPQDIPLQSIQKL